MLLLDFNEENSWLLSRWNTTYTVEWKHILKALSSVYDNYEELEILIESNPIEIKSIDEIDEIKESPSLTIRGFSNIIKLPLMITFYNQYDVVYVHVPSDIKEFKNIDYMTLNMSLCSYLDFIEIKMFSEN